MREAGGDVMWFSYFLTYALRSRAEKMLLGFSTLCFDWCDVKSTEKGTCKFSHFPRMVDMTRSTGASESVLVGKMGCSYLYFPAWLYFRHK